MQRSELTHVTDEDGDGQGDNFETINQGWGYTGNYHQYAFGLVRDRAGNFYGTTGLGFYQGGDRFKGTWLGTQDDIKYRGWVLKFTPKGELIPFAPGLRAPNGIGMSPEGEIFTTDNQGSYIACGWLMHVRQGEFLGHPSGLIDDPRFEEPWKLSREALLKQRKRPAAFLPHGVMGNSTSQPLWDTTDGRFGPFAGQVLVGDVQNGRLSRICLEKVDGEYQGAAIPFIYNRFGGGVNRLVFDPEGTLWVGFTGRGWAAGEGLKKVRYTGVVPAEIHKIQLLRKGFRLTFTQPMDPATLKQLDHYSIRHFELAWQPAYGTSPSKVANVKPVAAKVSADGRSVELELPELLAEKVYEFHVDGLRTEANQPLEHPIGLLYVEPTSAIIRRARTRTDRHTGELCLAACVSCSWLSGGSASVIGSRPAACPLLAVFEQCFQFSYDLRMFAIQVGRFSRVLCQLVELSGGFGVFFWQSELLHAPLASSRVVVASGTLMIQVFPVATSNRKLQRPGLLQQIGPDGLVFLSAE